MYIYACMHIIFMHMYLLMSVSLSVCTPFVADGGQKGKGTLVDQVASKGIWQAGASSPPPPLRTHAYICIHISINIYSFVYMSICTFIYT